MYIALIACSVCVCRRANCWSMHCVGAIDSQATLKLTMFTKFHQVVLFLFREEEKRIETTATFGGRVPCAGKNRPAIKFGPLKDNFLVQYPGHEIILELSRNMIWCICTYLKPVGAFGAISIPLFAMPSKEHGSFEHFSGTVNCRWINYRVVHPPRTVNRLSELTSGYFFSSFLKHLTFCVWYMSCILFISLCRRGMLISGVQYTSYFISSRYSFITGKFSLCVV